MTINKVLLVSATIDEVRGIVNRFGLRGYEEKNGDSTPGNLLVGDEVDCLITGVGQFFVTLSLVQRLTTCTYKLAVQAGIGGSFSDRHPLCSVVSVVEDAFGDCGAESPSGYLDLFEMGLWNGERYSFTEGMVLQQPSSLRASMELPLVKGVTVNRTLSSEQSIRWMIDRYSPDVASMEGAPFLYVCEYFGLPCLQISSISDRVGPRDKSLWDIPGAIAALEDPVCDIIARYAIEYRSQFG